MKSKYLALDTETGGLAVSNSLLTAYFGVLDDDKNVIAELSLKIKGKNGKYIYSEDALKHNGINIEQHNKEAIPLEEAKVRLTNFLKEHSQLRPLIPIGQNIEFDFKFIWEYLLDETQWWQYCTEEFEDTLKIAKAMAKDGLLYTGSFKLGVLCDKLGVVLLNAHTERDDALAAARLHTKLMEIKTQGKQYRQAVPMDEFIPEVEENLGLPEAPILRALSSYTILQSPSSIDDYIKVAKETGAPALSITDDGWFTSGLELYKKCKANNIIPIPGLKVNVADGPGKYTLTLWALNELGYRNLIKISSLGFSGTRMEGRQRYQDTDLGPIPRISLKELIGLSGGLAIGTGTGDTSLLYRMKDREEELRRTIDELMVCPLFIEVSPKPATHEWSPADNGFVKREGKIEDAQKHINNMAIDLHLNTGLSLLLSCDALYARPKDRFIREILNSQLDEIGFLKQHAPSHVMPTQEMYLRWNNGEDWFFKALEGSYELVNLAKDLEIKDKYHQPNPVMPIELEQEDLSYSDKLKVLLYQKIDKHGRMEWDNPKYTERLKKEMDVICDNGTEDFSKYFLFLEKWAEWTRQNNILSAPGRGSGGGSLLCYLLKITHLNPFQYDLPFERFLSLGRIKRNKWPDIDWDLGDREVLLEKLKEELGEYMAQCSTVGTLKVKSSIKDSFRFLVINPLEEQLKKAFIEQKAQIEKQIEDARLEVENVTKTIPLTPTGVKDIDFLMGYKDQEGNEIEGHLSQNEELQKFFVKYKEVYEVVLKLLGIPRSLGRHASAFIISDRPITESVPTCDISGYSCTQYQAGGDNYIEKAGLIKFDILKVNTLLDISNCIKMVHKRFNKTGLTIEDLPMADGSLLNIYKLPEDPKVFEMIGNGDTKSLFQISSHLLTGFCKRIKPNSINELGDIVALCRPGPLEAVIEDGQTTMTEAYIKRKHGKMPVTYPHPDMEPILKSTQAVAVYQEQVQKMFSDLAGYSLEEADYIRELIGKKKKQDMEKIIPDLKKRLLDRGWNEIQIEVFVSLCISSAKYSFNLSHSASYAYVAYMCAYLKYYFPQEWWTAVLQNSKIEDIKEKDYARELRDILVHPLVNGPIDNFEPKDGKVFSPLYLIEGVGDAACKAIKDVQGDGYTSFIDFISRVDRRLVKANVVEALIISGAFSDIEPDTDPKLLIKLAYYYGRIKKLKRYENMDLATAIADISEKEPSPDIKALAMDSIELVLEKNRILPISNIDLHQSFKNYLSKTKYSSNNKSIFMYDSNGVTYSAKDSYLSGVVLKSYRDFEKNYDKFNKKERFGFVGLVKDKKTFSYVDKKTGETVKALKISLSNAGDDVECILWPDTFKRFPDIKKSLLFVEGSIRESRDANKWSLYVDELEEL